MTPRLSEVLWGRVNDALDAGRSPWDDEGVIDWLAEHPEDFAPLERALACLHAGARARPPERSRARPRRAQLAAAAGFALAALLPFAARGARAPAPMRSPTAPPARPHALTVHALEIQVDRAAPRRAALTPSSPFAHLDVRVETSRHLNPRR